jgi:hypothetical protein
MFDSVEDLVLSPYDLSALRRLPADDREMVVDAVIADTLPDFLSELDAPPWLVEDYTIHDIELGDEECVVSLSFHARQDDWRAAAGLRIDAAATINRRGEVGYRLVPSPVASALEE